MKLDVCCFFADNRMKLSIRLNAAAESGSLVFRRIQLLEDPMDFRCHVCLEAQLNVGLNRRH